MDEIERLADLLRELPAVGKAERCADQAIALIARFQQAKILGHQPAGDVEGMKRRYTDIPCFVAGAVEEAIPIEAIEPRETLRQMPRQ